MSNHEFWVAMDRLVAESQIMIDRKKGTAHPKYPDLIYPVDYGYLKNTTSMDHGGESHFNSQNVSMIQGI